MCSSRTLLPMPPPPALIPAVESQATTAVASNFFGIRLFIIYCTVKTLIIWPPMK